jgi:NAD(P)-dependent dehydrogenase (short-subunit alcohol dehydrogenase family)
LELDGRVALVTGAACGLGRTPTLAMPDRRAHVAARMDEQARQAPAPIAGLSATDTEPAEAIG